LLYSNIRCFRIAHGSAAASEPHHFCTMCFRTRRFRTEEVPCPFARQGCIDSKKVAELASAIEWNCKFCANPMVLEFIMVLLNRRGDLPKYHLH